MKQSFSKKHPVAYSIIAIIVIIISVLTVFRGLWLASGYAVDNFSEKTNDIIQIVSLLIGGITFISSIVFINKLGKVIMLISIDEVRILTKERDLKRQQEIDKVILKNIEDIESLILTEAKNGAGRCVSTYPTEKRILNNLKEYFHSLGFEVQVDRDAGLLKITW